jgi:ribose 5-phosphate isomerase
MSSTESKPAFDLAEQQKALASMINTGFFADRTKDLLSVQADFLMGLENAITEWLNRRHEAIVDTQRLVSRLGDTQDPAEVWKAQQEWIANELHRLAADAAGCRQAASQVVAGLGRRIEAATQGVAETVSDNGLDVSKAGRSKTQGQRVSQDAAH